MEKRKNIFEEIIKEKPVLNLDEQTRKAYMLGLLLLGEYVTEDFLDLPRLIDESKRFSLEGYYYYIPYINSNMLYSDRNIMLLRIYELKSRSS